MCIYRHHPLIEGMLMLLPEDRDAMTAEALDGWLDVFEVNLRMLYDLPQLQLHPPADQLDLIRPPSARVAEAIKREAYLTGSSHDDLERIGAAVDEAHALDEAELANLARAVSALNDGLTIVRAEVDTPPGADCTGLAGPKDLIERAIERGWPITLLEVDLPDAVPGIHVDAGVARAVERLAEMHYPPDAELEAQIDADRARSQQPHAFSEGTGDVCAVLFCARRRGDLIHDVASPFTDDERAALTAQALATAREVTAATDAAEAAAELERERYPLHKLEAEARQPGPKPYTGPHPPSSAARPPAPAGMPPELTRPGPDREPVYQPRNLPCQYPSTVTGQVCGVLCMGDTGMRIHLANGHQIRGSKPENVARRAELIAAAHAALDAAAGHPVDVEPAAVDVVVVANGKAGEANADLAQVEADRRAGRRLPEPGPLDRAALSDLIADRTAPAPVVDVARTALGGGRYDPMTSLRCPYGPESRPCGAAVADAIVLDLHLRAVHNLDDDRARIRVGLVDQALEELDERIAEAAITAAADTAPATLASTEGKDRTP